MWMYIVVCGTSLAVAGLTLFSGFGLGTLLMPAMAAFFPIEVAIAATAVVHLANNVFKLLLVGRWIDFRVAIRFAVPAALAAMLGARLLASVAARRPLLTYELAGRECEITEVRLLIALLIAAFALLDFLPAFQKLSVSARWIPLGGALSGFFGGLSGNQGALRAAFLTRAGLDKERLIGTMVASAIVVDLARLGIYGVTFFSQAWETLRSEDGDRLVCFATIAAFVGSFIGARLVKKVTLEVVHRVVGIMLLLLAVALGTGVV